MILKLKRFFTYSKAEKTDIILRRLTSLIFSFTSAFKLKNRLAFSYLPDSIAHDNAYPDVKTLYDKFRKKNKSNNGGDIHRLTSLILNIEKILFEDKVEGDFAELGVWRGNSSAVLAFYAKKTNRHCFLLDTFEGFSEKDLKGYDSQFDKGHFSNTSIEIVKDVIGSELIDVCSFLIGYFPESITEELKSRRFSIVSLDADLYEPTKAGLEWFFPRMNDGGIFLLHDYSSRGWDGCKRAIDEFCHRENQKVVLIPDKSGSAFVIINKPKDS